MNKQDELRIRLEFLIPLKWMDDFSTQNGDKTDILSSVVELNPEWVEEVLEGDYKLSDVLHDFKGIYAEDEHFLPRIQSDAVDVKEHTFDEVWDNIIEYGIATEDELRLVCHINGNKIESLNDVLEVRTPYKDWSQYKSMEG